MTTTTTTTDAEKIEQVEHALDGTRELIAEVRALAEVDVCLSLDGEEEDFLERAKHTLGRDVFRKIWKATKEVATTEYYSYRAAEDEEQYDRAFRYEYARKFYGVKP